MQTSQKTSQKNSQRQVRDAIAKRYLPIINVLAEQIANDIKFRLEIEILKRLGTSFYLKNLPYALLMSSVIFGGLGTIIAYLPKAQPKPQIAEVKPTKPIARPKPKIAPKQKRTHGTQIRSRK